MARPPYGAFNFIVKIGGDDFGGFSDVSGLETELQLAEYRNGNDKTNYVTKVPGLHTASDVTLKRGVVDSEDMWEWVRASRSPGDGDRGVLAKRDVIVTLLDETGQGVQSWKLLNALPMKYTGPTLAAKGGGDVAMEELVLAVEAIDLTDVSA